MKIHKVGKKSTLLLMYDNLLLRTKVDSALDSDDKTYQDIVAICKTYGINLSVASVSRYAQMRQLSIKSGQDLREMLDGKTRETLRKIKEKREGSKTSEAIHHELTKSAFTALDEAKINSPEEIKPTKVEYLNYVDVLEEVVKQGLMTLRDGQGVAPKDLISAIKTISQITNNGNNGLSSEGLQQLRLFQTATEQAMTTIILKYITKDKQEKVLQEMKDEEQRRYAELDTSKQGRALMKAMRESDIKL